MVSGILLVFANSELVCFRLSIRSTNFWKTFARCKSSQFLYKKKLFSFLFMHN